MRNAVTRLYDVDSQRPPASLSLPGPVRRWVVDADLTDEQVLGLILWCVLGSLSLVIVGLVATVWSTLVMGSALAALPCIVIIRCSGRRMRSLIAALPDLIDGFARSLRSGASFGQALREASIDAPPVVGRELGRIIREIDRGQTSRHALYTWAVRTPASEVRIVAAALAVASENEAGTSLALAGVSQSLRDRNALSAEIGSHTAQAAASMQAMVLLPAGLLLLDALGDQDRLRYLTGERLGQGCLAAALALTALGWLWMRAIVHHKLPS